MATAIEIRTVRNNDSKGITITSDSYLDACSKFYLRVCRWNARICTWNSGFNSDNKIRLLDIVDQSCCRMDIHGNSCGNRHSCSGYRDARTRTDLNRVIKVAQIRNMEPRIRLT